MKIKIHCSVLAEDAIKPLFMIIKVNIVKMKAKKL